ncbi:tubulin-specific chaperone E-like protein [Leptotrombidium deliense]|uniref:Leucine-rich repeat-containing protein 51 n=1 Tax=Leptotrombidium deliense TaxID=299467 RepID=A0A443SW53_9ACAR|nr:tubulin-specific chaperone E-like protein [Leptotrombidium deliense]
MSRVSTKPAINSRVECDDVYGTVKYVGSVTGTSGVWIGVDWDSSERGKHDGSYKDIRYFNASKPNSGSFIRATKLNFGKSFFEALIDRYENNVEMASEALLTLSQNQGTDRRIELIGFDKVAEKLKNLSQLLVIDLCKQCIAYAGHNPSVKLPTANHLDISSNLLSSWTEVAKIVTHLPSLEGLVVSGNKLVVEKCDNLSSHFDKVKYLVFGKVGYTWNDVISVIGSLFRYMESLDVWGNAITEIAKPLNGIFSPLKSLNLSDNKISDWQQICKLGDLPLLENLQLRNCDITEIYFDDNLLPTEKTQLFPVLKCLNLSQNCISKWTSVANLNRLPSLEVLQISSNPVYGKEKYDTVYNLIIGKIAKLQVLNKAEISKCQRKEAEVYYLKRFYSNWLEKGEENVDSFIREHPLYAQLLNYYGEPTELQNKSANNREKKFIQVKLKYAQTEKVIDKRLPSNMTIRMLRVMVKRLFNIGPFKPFDLIVENANRSKITYSLDDELETLNYFSVENGDTIVAQAYL